MKPENLPPITRMIMRETALGLTPEDIVVNHPEMTVEKIKKMQRGAPFKKGLEAMQSQIDQELITHQAEDPVRQYLNSKGLAAAKTLVRLMEDEDTETPHAVQAKCADSLLSKAGYASASEEVAVPILMLSPEKLASIQNPKAMALENVPDSVDGHQGDLGVIIPVPEPSVEAEEA